MCEPATGCRTGRLDLRPMISAIRLRWRGSRCWTTTIPASNVAGRVLRILVSALRPPAEAAIATISNGGLLAPRIGPRSITAQQPSHISRDLDLLPRMDDQGSNLGRGTADVSVATDTGVVPRIELCPQESQPGNRFAPDGSGVLPHTAREHDRVQATHRSRHRRDARAKPVNVDVEREARPLVSGRHSLFHLAHVLRPGETEEARAAVERFRQLAF